LLTYHWFIPQLHGFCGRLSHTAQSSAAYTLVSTWQLQDQLVTPLIPGQSSCPRSLENIWDWRSKIFAEVWSVSNVWIIFKRGCHTSSRVCTLVQSAQHKQSSWL